MFAQESEFFRRSKAIVEKFLQTIVIIDDEAYFGGESTVSSDGSEYTSEDIKDQPTGAHTRPQLKTPRFESQAVLHSLDAQEIINSFARKKIICSVIKPNENLDLPKTIEDLASSADIIIIDWKLNENGEQGEEALNILELLSKAAAETPEQLRLIAIYTGEPDILNIAEKIKQVLTELLGDQVKEEDGGFTLTYKSIRIVVFAKSHTSLPEEYQERQVVFGELADRVTNEFAKMTAGLVSNVAVEALTCVRQNMFRILDRFTQELDAPYVTHRLLQPEPSDAESHLVALLSEEIRAILEERKVGEEAGATSISDWLDSSGIQEIEPFRGKKLSKGILVQLAESGINEIPDGTLSNNERKKLYKHLTRALLKSSEDNNHDEKFAVLTNLRSFYENSDRVLTLGTVIKLIATSDDDKVTPSYYLCLQPVCDTVRLSEKRAFPFIPLDEVVDGDDAKFSIVVSEVSSGETHFVRLLPKTETYHLKLIEFEPENQDRIVSSQVEGDYVFTDISGNKYKWIGELRSEHGMRSINNLAATMSRVGLNESEWLRLSGR